MGEWEGRKNIRRNGKKERGIEGAERGGGEKDREEREKGGREEERKIKRDGEAWLCGWNS